MSGIIEKLLDNDGKNRLIVRRQKETPLLLKNVSPLHIYSQGGKIKNVLYDAVFTDGRGRDLVCYKLQLETLRTIPLHTEIFNDAITQKGTIETFSVDTASIAYARLGELPPSTKAKIDAKLPSQGGSYEAFAICKTQKPTLLIPSMVIGSFFYFPNTPLRRAFFKQSIELIMHPELSDCKHHGICLKNGVKFTETTVLLAYLYHCNPIAGKFFYNAFSYFVRNKVKNQKPGYAETGTKEAFNISYPKFRFPFQGSSEIVVRGNWLDEEHFLAYEIVDMSMAPILGTDTITGYYEGRKPSIVSSKTFKRGKSNAKTVSHTSPYTSHFEAVGIESMTSVVGANDVTVKKGPAVATGEETGAYPSIDRKETGDGATLGNEKDEASSMARASVNLLDYDFKKAVEHLKELLKPWGGDYNLVETGEYFFFEFRYGKRFCLIVEMKTFRTSTLIFSSPTPFDGRKIASRILDIKKGIPFNCGDRTLCASFRQFGKALREKRGICFHPIQQHTGKDLPGWARRVVEKLDRPAECRG